MPTQLAVAAGGALGALTRYLVVIEEGGLAVAFTYAVASVAIGVAAVFAGSRLGRVL
jgi:fluoride ion exporter CrcB/FEX